ncbi:hypothetical protein BRC91_05065 [Halobacteriales archaeon QS_4_62_28]|nr:MAG: hypothetical protein BRC91_05065 [Halobacteriales archaeon QS_4_62_28]
MAGIKRGGRGDVRRLSKRGGDFVIRTDDADDDGKRTARSYLAKSLRTLSVVADMSPGDVDDAASARRSGDVDNADLWKIALYWATGKAFFDGSPELTTDDSDDKDGDTLPHVLCYRFVGVARYNDLPGYVRRRTVFLKSSNVWKPPS